MRAARVHAALAGSFAALPRCVPNSRGLSRRRVLAAASPQPPPGASGGDERRYTELSSASLLRAAAARAGPARFRPEDGAEDGAGDAARDDAADTERVGVLLLNLGGPETLSDVQPFLYNLFADPDIIRLPPAAAFLQKPLANFISKARAPKVRPSRGLRTRPAPSACACRARRKPSRRGATRRVAPCRRAGLRPRPRGAGVCRPAPVSRRSRAQDPRTLRQAR